MAHLRTSHFPIWFCIYSILIIATVAQDPGCDQRQCTRGPWPHYKSLNCIPVYKNSECCPWRYDCDHLFRRTEVNQDQCYFNHKEYKIHEDIDEKDLPLCYSSCTCYYNRGLADFKCRKRECLIDYKVSPGCIPMNQLSRCCTTDQICPDTNVQKPNKCNWLEPLGTQHGFAKQIFSRGEYIKSEAEPDKLCLCHGNVTGIGINYECVNFSLWFDPNAAEGFYRQCAPIYYPFEEYPVNYGIQRIGWRCTKHDDFVFHKKSPDLKFDTILNHGPLRKFACPAEKHFSETGEIPIITQLERDKDCIQVNWYNWVDPLYMKGFFYRELCILGQMTMHIGDQLKRHVFNENDGCIVCTCEVPPVPTCIVKKNVPCSEFNKCGDMLVQEHWI